MPNILDKANDYLQQTLIWAQAEILSYETLGQVAVIVLLFFTSYGLDRWLRPLIKSLVGHKQTYQKSARYVEPLYLPVIWLILQSIAQRLAFMWELPQYLLWMGVSLLMAWIVIRLASQLIRNRELARLVRFFAWGVAALNIVGWLEPTIMFLDAAAVDIGDAHVSALAVLTGIFTLCLLIWGGLVLANLLEMQLGKLSTITPSARVLLGKLARIIFVSVAFLFAISSMGIDLTALAVFGGAIGVGLGFGLQKVVSNFISGVILLLDRSIKPGDVVEVSGTYGRIDSLAARYTSIISRDGREHLVPNEDMITQPVINWTYTNTRVRRHLPVGVSYKSDLRRAMTVMKEAALKEKRVIENPAPLVLIKGFGDNSVDLELRVWISDPQNGVSNVASAVYLNIWDMFHREGIEFPFPQRDIHLVSMPGDTPPKGIILPDTSESTTS
ncbi:MAG: mechanosensitive ion channel protein MscS [Kordiimonas sp.]|nr:mechanosensitive ion channel protein MscS [Kordiimonas sp.]